MYCGDCVELGCHSTSEDCYDCSGCSDLRGKFQVKCESKNGLSDVCFYVEKFDTAASMNMSGVSERLVPGSIVELNGGVTINGFNGSKSSVTTVGVNQDKKREYFVRDMPDNLALLCAHMYASDGAAILFRDGGVVVKLSDSELSQFKEYIAEFHVFKRLKVVNRTYEIDNSFVASASECAHSSTAANYFNTKVNVT